MDKTSFKASMWITLVSLVLLVYSWYIHWDAFSILANYAEFSKLSITPVVKVKEGSAVKVEVELNIGLFNPSYVSSIKVLNIGLTGKGLLVNGMQFKYPSPKSIMVNYKVEPRSYREIKLILDVSEDVDLKLVNLSLKERLQEWSVFILIIVEISHLRGSLNFNSTSLATNLVEE